MTTVTEAATTEWMRLGACVGVDPGVFFPTGTRQEVQRAARAAKRVCGACPVRSTCLEWALSTPETEGIWGGLTSDQRLTELVRQRRSSPLPVSLEPCGTLAAYRRHLRRGECIDPACREANRVAAQERKATRHACEPEAIAS